MIETERLIIRGFTEDDREIVTNLLQDAEFMEYSDGGAFDSEDASRRFDQIRSYATAGIGKQAMILKDSGEIAGYCGIEPFQINGQEERELGYRVVAKYRGKGLATEAALAVLRNYKGQLFAYLDRDNKKSAGIVKKLGFSHQGACNVHGKEYDLYQRHM